MLETHQHVHDQLIWKLFSARCICIQLCICNRYKILLKLLLSSWENLLIANFLVLSFIKSSPRELETCSNLIYFLNVLLKCVQLKSSSSFDISVDDICGALRPSLLFPVSFLSWFSFALLGSAIMANFQIYVTSYRPLIHSPPPCPPPLPYSGVVCWSQYKVQVNVRSRWAAEACLHWSICKGVRA